MPTHIHNLEDKRSLEKFFTSEWSTLQQSEIKKIYKKLAIDLHPDKNPEGEVDFKKLAHWYNLISDHKTKQELKLDIQELRQNTYSKVNTATYNSGRDDSYNTTTRTRRRRQAPFSFTDDKKWRTEYDDYKSKKARTSEATTRNVLDELLIEQKIGENYTAITEIIYKIKLRLSTQKEALSSSDANDLLYKIEEGRARIVGMLSDNYQYKNYLSDSIKTQLQNMLNKDLKDMQAAVKNTTSRPKAKAAQTSEAPPTTHTHRRKAAASRPKLYC